MITWKHTPSAAGDAHRAVCEQIDGDDARDDLAWTEDWAGDVLGAHLGACMIDNEDKTATISILYVIVMNSSLGGRNSLRRDFRRWKTPISARVSRKSSGPTNSHRRPILSLSRPFSPKLRTAGRRYGFISYWFGEIIRPEKSALLEVRAGEGLGSSVQLRRWNRCNISLCPGWLIPAPWRCRLGRAPPIPRGAPAVSFKRPATWERVSACGNSRRSIRRKLRCMADPHTQMRLGQKLR